MLRRIVILFLITMLASCGFKLRGFYDMPAWFNQVAIVNQGTHRDLPLMLKDQLQAYHICVVPDINHSLFTLVLEKDSFQQQMTSVGASTTPRQYELIYTVYYSLLKTKGAPILPSSPIIIVRQLTVNNDRILGSNAEEGMIYHEMRRDAALQIINRISGKLA